MTNDINTKAGTKAYEGFEPDMEAFVVTIPDGACRCGCGDPLTNPKRSFLQGHDARYKGLLQRAYRANESVAIVEGGAVVSSDALSLAEDRGWGHFMTEAPKRAGKSRAKKVSIKVGRWTHEATIVKGVATYTKGDGSVVKTSKFKLA